MGLNFWIAAGCGLALSMANGQASAADQKQIAGVAAYYSKDYKGRTASGATYDPDKFTCAHRTLPFGTHLRVTDPQTKRSVTVTVNDRGPFSKGRVLDLSLAAAKSLRIIDRGLAQVTASVE
jgi:peptidoglycan lytic transglycosylase